MKKQLKVQGGKINVEFIADKAVDWRDWDLDKQITKMRYDILDIETQLLKMWQKKESFDFGTHRYNNMVMFIKQALNDLQHFESRVKEIKKFK